MWAKTEKVMMVRVAQYEMFKNKHENSSNYTAEQRVQDWQ